MLKVKKRAKPEDFGDLFRPDEAIEPILAKPVRLAFTEWLEEIWSADELAAVGVKPRRRAIFDGVPGVGKTTLAHHLAARLGLTMLAVRPERLIDKWLGSSAINIGELFDCVAPVDGAEPILLFMDEFDAVAPTRGRVSQSIDQERNAYVNTLLQRIEQFEGFLIAAANFGDRIDAAIWRRFEIQVTLELPGQVERERLLERYLQPFGLPAGALRELAIAVETASPALIRSFCENLKRQIVVGPKLKHDMSLGAVIDRLVASCHPHPSLGKPRLWSLAAGDHALQSIPWPLPCASDLPAEAAAPAPPAGLAETVVPFGRRP